MRIAIATNDGIHVNRCDLQKTNWNIYDIDERVIFVSIRFVQAECDQICENCARLLESQLGDCDLLVVSDIDPKIPFLLRMKGMQVISNMLEVEPAIKNIRSAEQRSVSSDYYRKINQYLAGAV